MNYKKMIKLQLLVECGLYNSSMTLNVLKPEKVLNFDKLNFTTCKTNLRPCKELEEEFYTFFMTSNSSNIDEDFLIFFKDFENEIYGMEYADKRKIALKHFKNKYSEVIPKFSLGFKSISESGLERFETLNRFIFSKGARNAISTKLATIKNISAYLIGDKMYFESNDFKNQETYKKAINFESTLKILLSLNDTYQFEEDTTFSNLGVLKEKYSEYKNVFLNFEVFIWTQKKIQSFIENKPSNIDSLHQALLELLLISEKKKSFIDYINQEHNMSITKIRHYALGTNLSHDFRIKKSKKSYKI